MTDYQVFCMSLLNPSLSLVGSHPRRVNISARVLRLILNRAHPECMLVPHLLPQAANCGSSVALRAEVLLVYAR